MSTHTVSITFTSGTIIYASSTNKNNSDFASTINNLNSQNLIASAVGTTQLESGAVTTGKIYSEAVMTSNIASASVIASKLDGDVILFKEVFS